MDTNISDGSGESIPLPLDRTELHHRILYLHCEKQQHWGKKGVQDRCQRKRWTICKIRMIDARQIIGKNFIQSSQKCSGAIKPLWYYVLFKLQLQLK